jgi:HNH endonuclease
MARRPDLDTRAMVARYLAGETAAEIAHGCSCSKFCVLRRLRQAGVAMRPAMVRPNHIGRFWSRVLRTDTCWLWIGRLGRAGYGSHSVGRRSVFAHRFSYELAYGPIPEGLLVCHHCDNPPCVRPDHLFLGTYSDNGLDMVAKGRSIYQRDPSYMHRARASLDLPGGKRMWGEQHPAAKLTLSDVAAIRETGADSRAEQLLLAARYGVSERAIRSVVKRQTWRRAS